MAARPASKGSGMPSARNSAVLSARNTGSAGGVGGSGMAKSSSKPKVGGPSAPASPTKGAAGSGGGGVLRRPSGLSSSAGGGKGGLTGSLTSTSAAVPALRDLPEGVALGGGSGVASATDKKAATTAGTAATAASGLVGMGTLSVAGPAGAGFGGGGSGQPLTGIALYAQLTGVDGLNVTNPVLGLLAKHSHASALDDEPAEWSAGANAHGAGAGAAGAGGAGSGGVHQGVGGAPGTGQGSGAAPGPRPPQYDEKGNLIPDVAVEGSGATADPEVAAMVAEAAAREAAEQAAAAAAAGLDGADPLNMTQTTAGGMGTQRSSVLGGGAGTGFGGSGGGGTVADQLRRQVEDMIAGLENRQRSVAEVSNICGLALNRISDDINSLKTQTKMLKLEQLTCIARAARNV